MASAVVGALRVDLGINSAQFTTQLKQTQAQINTFAASAQKSFIGLSHAVTALSTIATAVMGGSFLFAVKKGIEAGDKIAKTSQRVGIAAEAYQELSYAAKLAGVSQEDFDKSLEQMNRRLGEVNLKGTAAQKALERIGITAAQIKGQSPDKVFALILDRISRIADPMQKAAIAQELFGRSGQQLLVLAKDGSAGLRAMADEARKLGFVLSKETLDKTEKASDEFDRITMSMRSAGIQIGAGFLPALESIRRVMTSQDFQDGIKTVAAEMGKFVKFLVDNGPQIAAVTVSLITFAKASAMLKSPFLGFLAGAAAGIATFEQLRGELDRTERSLETLERRRKELLEGGRGDPEKAIIPQDILDKRRQAVKRLEESFLGLQKVAERGDPDATRVFQARADRHAAELEAINKEIDKLESLNAARQKVAGQPLTTNQKAQLADLDAQIEQHRKKIAELRAAAVEPTAPARQQIDVVTNVNLKAIEEITNDIQFKAAQARGEFAKFAPGFIEAARTAGLFGKEVSNIPREMSKLAPEMQKLNAEFEKLKNAEQLKSIAKGIGDALGSAFESAIVDAKSFQEVIRSLYKDLLRLFIRKLITEPFGNFLTAGIGNVFPGRALGGPVTAGQMYQVGERGRELFVPNTDGRIIPHNQLNKVGNGDGLTYAPVIDMRGADQGAVARMEMILREHSRQLMMQGRSLASAQHFSSTGVLR